MSEWLRSRYNFAEGFPIDIVETPEEVEAAETAYMRALQELLQLNDEEMAEYIRNVEKQIEDSEQ